MRSSDLSQASVQCGLTYCLQNGTLCELPLASQSVYTGGSGGSGIVVIRYNDSEGQKATGGTVTTSPGYIIHTFTGDGNFNTNTNWTGSQYSIN